MTGLDTNILVRYFMQDDPDRIGLAQEVIEGLSPGEPGWICLPVLVELVWVLIRTYRLKKPAVAYVIETLLRNQDLRLEQADSVRISLRLFRDGRADFQDCLIATVTKGAGCARTVTFDEAAARSTDMELLS